MVVVAACLTVTRALDTAAWSLKGSVEEDVEVAVVTEEGLVLVRKSLEMVDVGELVWV